MPDVSDLLQWTGVAISSATCFIAAALSFYVFIEQKKSSQESKDVLARLADLEAAKLAARNRDEFHMWVIGQIIAMEEDISFITETIAVQTNGLESTQARMDEARESIGRKLYELKIFSGDDRTIKLVSRQLIGIYPDSRTLMVLELAADALNDQSISQWLRDQIDRLRRRLFPAALVDSRRWTGR